MNKRSKAVIMLYIIALIWGFAFIAIDYSLANGYGVFYILALRGLIAGLLLLPFFIKNKFWKNKHTFVHSIVCGVFFFLGYACQTIGQMHSSSDKSAFYTAFYVIFTPFIAYLFGKKSVKIKNFISIGLAIVGIFFLTFMANGLSFSFGISEVMLLLCALFFAFQIVWVSKYLKESDPLGSSSVMLLSMGILSLIAFFISSILGYESLPTSIKGFAGVLFAAIFSSGICSVLQFKAQKDVSPTKASLILVLETPIAIILSWIFGYSKINPLYSVIGLVFLMGAIILSTIERKSYYLDNYKTLLIDIDDTILDFKKTEEAAFNKTLMSYGIKPKKEYLEAYSIENLRLWKAYERGEIEQKDIFELRMVPIVNKFNFTFDPVEFSYKYLKALGDFVFELDHSFKHIKRLAKKYDLYIVSNGDKYVQLKRIEASGIGVYFKDIFISEIIGVQKPKKEFFDYIKTHVKDFDSSKTLIIGDSLTSDIKGAIDYGIDACWFNPKGKKTDLNIKYDIKSLEQVR